MAFRSVPSDIARAITALGAEERAFARHVALDENAAAQDALDRLVDAAVALDVSILAHLNREPPVTLFYPVPVQVFGRDHLPS